MSYGFSSFDSLGSVKLTMDDSTLLILYTEYIPANTSGSAYIPTLDPTFARAFVLPIGFNKTGKLPSVNLYINQVVWASANSTYAVNCRLVVVTK